MYSDDKISGPQNGLSDLRFCCRILLLLIAALVAVFMLYAYSDIPVPGSTPMRLAREVDGHRLWTNGYLGVFLRPKYFGNLNWLALPLFALFLLRIRKAQRWQVALITALVLTAVLVGKYGYYNYRYALTIAPIVLALALAYGWQNIKKQSSLVKSMAVICVLGLSLYNISRYWPLYNDLWKISTLESTSAVVPEKIINLVRDVIPDKDTVALVHSPVLNYMSDRKFISYEWNYIWRVPAYPGVLQAGWVDDIFALRGSTAALTQWQIERAAASLRDKYSVKYIVLGYKQFAPEMEMLLSLCGKKIAEEPEYSLYRLKNYCAAVQAANSPDQAVMPISEAGPRARMVHSVSFASWAGPDRIINYDAEFNGTIPDFKVVEPSGDFVFSRLNENGATIVRLELGDRALTAESSLYAEAGGRILIDSPYVTDANKLVVKSRIRCSEKFVSRVRLYLAGLIDNKKYSWYQTELLSLNSQFHDYYLEIDKPAGQALQHVRFGIQYLSEQPDNFIDIQELSLSAVVPIQTSTAKSVITHK